MVGIGCNGSTLIRLVANPASVIARLGLGALVASSITVFTVVKFLGAAYLIYLGIQAIRHRRVRGPGTETDAALARTSKVLREGFVVGVTNPKMIVFLAAALPQFVNRDAGAVPAQMLLLGLIVPVITLTSDGLWALFAGTARTWFARSPRRLEALGGAGGFAMIGIGVSLAVSGRKD